jgi:hypothetical protein
MAWYHSAEERAALELKDGGSVKATPKRKYIGEALDFVGSKMVSIGDAMNPSSDLAQDFGAASGQPIPFGDLLGLTSGGKFLQDMAYEGSSPTRGGSLQTSTLDPRLIDVASIMLPMAGPSAKVAGKVAKKGGLEAARLIDNGLTHGIGPLSSLQHLAPRIIDPSHMDLAFPEMLESVLRGSDGKLSPIYNGGPSLKTGLPHKGQGIYSEGTYFSGIPERVVQYAEKHEAPTTYPMYANLKNPISADDFRARFGYASPKTSASIKDTLVNEGYDGVLSMLGDRIWEGVAFHPQTQLKSAISSVSPKQVTELKDAATANAYKDLYSRTK